MFADPQSVTINAIANSLPRTGQGVSEGNFSKDDGTVKLKISHLYGKRSRRLIRLDHRKIAADPLATGYNKEYAMSAWLVVDVPTVGYSVTEQKQVVDGLTAYLTASSGAKVTQLLGGES